MLGSLAGTLAFVMDVEPTFFATLQRKYGVETLETIVSSANKENRMR